MKLSEIAQRTGCELHASEDVEIRGVAGIDEAGAGDLTFVSNRKYISRIKKTCASAIILGQDIPEVSIPSLRTPQPYLAFAKALELFYTPPSPDRGIHPTAVISEDSRLGPDAAIGAYAVISRGVVLGARATIHPHVVIYPGVKIGDDVVIHSGATVREYCEIGNGVTIQNGAIIGSDGFGFAPQEDGTYYTIPQSGTVIIEDDVDIGANTTVDRAAVGITRIRRGAKLDNMVQVGHGAQVGEDNVLAAQVGVAGSTHLGRNVQVGGQVGFAGHTEVGDGAIITAQSGTSHDIEAGKVVSGSPAFDTATWRRAVAAFRKLPELLRQVRRLEKEIAELRSDLDGPAK
jgi:UDP-3-O-[3-hydroxymyristoyl] glucosamine N-acyltransferase